jgi:hypothetical protein
MCCSTIIAIVGPDGVGKTSVLNRATVKLQEILADVEIRHWRPGILPPLKTFWGKSVETQRLSHSVAPRRTPGRFHFARILYYWFDFLIGYYVRDCNRVRVVLYDRCALDMAVDPLRYGLSSTQGTILLSKLAPKPDRVILLYDQADRIHARKSELSEEEITRQSAEWIHLAEKGRVDTIIQMDAPVEEIAGHFVDLVKETVVRKCGGSLHISSKPIDWFEQVLAGDGNSGVVVRAHSGQYDHLQQKAPPRTFGLLQLKDGRGYLVPLDSKKTAVLALNLFNAQTFRARLYKRLLKAALRWGIGQYALKKVSFGARHNSFQAQPKGILGIIEQTLGREDLVFAASLGTPGPLRKPVMLVMTSEGETLAYAKIGWNESTNQIVEHEARVLNEIGNSRLSLLNVPRMLACTGPPQNRILLIEPVGHDRRCYPRKLAQVLPLLMELSLVEVCLLELRESSFLLQLNERLLQLRSLGGLGPFRINQLRQCAATVERSLVGIRLPFVRKHGDFAPWNVWKSGSMVGAWVIDWERSQNQSLPGWDLFYFALEGMGVNSSLGLERLFHTRESMFYFERVGVNPHLVPQLFLLFLVDLISSYWHHDLQQPGLTCEQLQWFTSYLDLLNVFYHRTFR